MSRPTKKQMGNYHFFIELLSADTQYETIILVIENLKKDFDVKVLGIYQVLE
jgi:prephenate dehydratase